jgi:hypothetical protein
MEHVYLPVSVEELVFYSPGAEVQGDDRMNIVSKASRNGFRTLHSDIEVTSPSGELLMNVLKMCSRKLAHQISASSIDSTSDRTPFLRVNWKPEISSFLESKAHISNLLQSVKSTDEALSHIIDLIGHANPDVTILHLLHPNELSSAEVMLKALNGERRSGFSQYSQYKIVFDDGEAVDSGSLDTLIGTYQNLEVEEVSAFDSGLTPAEAIDVIMVSDLGSEDLQLVRLQRQLRSGGFFLGITDESCSKEILEALESLGFALKVFNLVSNNKYLIIAFKNNALPTKVEPKPLLDHAILVRFLLKSLQLKINGFL